MEEDRSINELWKSYNLISSELSKKMNRTNNIVGEFGENLALRHYGGELLVSSSASADLIDENNISYQIKTRKLAKLKSTSLGIVRSHEFDFLIVIIFDLNGSLLRALEVPIKVVEQCGKRNDFYNEWFSIRSN